MLAALRLAVPVVDPIVTVVADPAKFTVATLAFIRLKVVAVVVKDPPLTAIFPFNTESLSVTVPISAAPKILRLPTVKLAYDVATTLP